ncbi:MAG: hypothetical protein H6Q18_251 [Bacteroidetes bacterium]|nr:hypothetical protein [Bacteroidota bacterium]
MKFKDFFYFSKGQRIGIIVLLSLIFLTLLSTFIIPYLIKPEKAVEDTAFLEEAEKFRASLREKEYSQANKWEKYPDFYKPFPKKNYKKTSYQLFTFDPNQADSTDFVRLGLKPYIAKNILKYRNKGGKFRKAEDFGKVYGISPEKMNELLPYIQIADNKQNKTDQNENNEPETKPEKSAIINSGKKDIIVELNSADTTSLLQIRGIGRKYAKGIVGYRRILGGYYSVEQLREVYGMRPENFEKIKPFLTIDPSFITKINVNKASIERLKSHPYFNFSKAKSLYEYRRDKGKLRSMDDLRNLKEFSTEDLTRIEPYLSFE